MARHKKRTARPDTNWSPSGTLTIATVRAQWSELVTHLQGTGPMAVDLSALTRVDTAGVQVLLAARREAERRGIAFHVTGLTLPDPTRALLGITQDAAIAASSTPAVGAGQEG